MTRISTFQVIVAPNFNYDVFLTSTPPNDLRFRLLNTDASYKIRLSMYYFSATQRIDLYLNGVYVPPTNAYYVSGNMILKNVSNNTGPYMPTYTNTSGTNLFVNNRMYFTLSGADVVDLQIAPVLFISFSLPAMTPDQFFDPTTLVNNFAALLGLLPSQIKTVNIISATNSSSFNNANGRRKRDLSSTIKMINLTIYDNPVTFLNNSLGLNTTSSALILASARITNQFATGQLQARAQALFNVSLISMNIRPPQSAPNASAVTIGQVNNLQVVQQASGCNAQVPCQVQPILKIVDQNVGSNLIAFKIALKKFDFH